MPNAQDVLWFKSEFQPQIEAADRGNAVQRRHDDRVRLPGDRRDLAGAAPAGPADGADPRALRRRHDRCLADRRRPARIPEEQGRAARGAAAATACSRSRARAWSTWPSTSRTTAAPRRGPTSSATASASSSSTCSSSRPSPTTSSNGTTPTSTLALARCVGELKAALKRLGWQAKTSLSETRWPPSPSPTTPAATTRRAG